MFYSTRIYWAKPKRSGLSWTSRDLDDPKWSKMVKQFGELVPGSFNHSLHVSGVNEDNLIGKEFGRGVGVAEVEVWRSTLSTLSSIALLITQKTVSAVCVTTQHLSYLTNLTWASMHPCLHVTHCLHVLKMFLRKCSRNCQEARSFHCLSISFLPLFLLRLAFIHQNRMGWDGRMRRK